MTTETAPQGTVVETGRAPTMSIRTALQSNIRDYGLLLVLIVIMLAFQWFTNGTLFKPVNLTNLVLQNSYIIVMALGMLP